MKDQRTTSSLTPNPESLTPPLLAVVIPTYNRAALLPVALDSVIAQTTPARIEVAVVDDGSTDNTRQVIEPYLRRHREGKVVIRYTALQKQGVVTARNTAIAQTTAPFIAILDSDDYWDPRKLEKQLAAMGDESIGVCHTSFRYVDEQGRLTDEGPQRQSNPCVGECLDVLLDEFLVLFSSVLIRRRVVEEAAALEDHKLPFDPRWTNAQDYDLILRAARRCRFAYVPEPLTYYRFHGGHGAMGNLKRAYGFHCRVQMDFVRRYGRERGWDEAEGKRRAAAFLWGRAESLFWQRQLATCRDLCALADELGVADDRFRGLARRASRPAWVYKVKDRLDRALGKRLK